LLNTGDVKRTAGGQWWLSGLTRGHIEGEEWDFWRKAKKKYAKKNDVVKIMGCARE